MAINPKNLTIELSPPITGSVEIDFRDHFPDADFELVSVGEYNTAATDSISILSNKKGIVYVPNLNCSLWNYPTISADTFEYTIKDLSDSELTTGTVSVNRIELDGTFVAEDIFIYLKDPIQSIIEVDVGYFNHHTDVQLLDANSGDTNYIKSVSTPTDEPNKVIIDLNEDTQWDDLDDKTYVDYQVLEIFSGETSKARIYIAREGNSFFAPLIEIDLDSSVYSPIDVDVSTYAIPEGSYLSSIGHAHYEKGLTSLISMATSGDFNNDYGPSFIPYDRIARYSLIDSYTHSATLISSSVLVDSTVLVDSSVVIDSTILVDSTVLMDSSALDYYSGYWGESDAFDFFRYTVKSSERKASNYIFIYKDLI